MVVVAVLSAVAIVYSSFSYKTTQKERFQKAIVEHDSLMSKPRLVINTSDSIRFNQLTGKDFVVVFWATWSEKSDLMMQEIYTLQDQIDSLIVISALVLDAHETIDQNQLNDSFIHIDGASLYNELKVPGIPSYILFSKYGSFKYAHIGYQENAGYRVLKEKINE